MHRITLDNDEFEGRNNAYLLDGDGIGLIDTGIATESTRAALKAGLTEHGYAFEDIDTVALTHWHADHTGLVGEIQAESGATVYAHERDVPLASGDPAAVEAYGDLQRSRFDQWGMPEGKLEELLAFFDATASFFGSCVDVTPVRDGDEIVIGGQELLVSHAPGHTDGSAIYTSADGTLAFGGDVLLPVYTPNIGGADLRVDRPLATYLNTLDAITEDNIDRVLPGHRDPIGDPADRAEVIIDHHHERTSRVLEVLREHGPADAWTVSAHLFGELQAIHIMHGPGEAYAHLDHLQHVGMIDYDDRYYYPPDDTATAEAALHGITDDR